MNLHVQIYIYTYVHTHTFSTTQTNNMIYTYNRGAQWYRQGSTGKLSASRCESYIYKLIANNNYYYEQAIAA